MERLNEYTFDIDHSMVSGIYSGMYGIIYNANLIIDLMEPDTQVKKQAVAEAKFFRAWANFELVTLFGTAPKVDHLLLRENTVWQTARPKSCGASSNRI